MSGTLTTDAQRNLDRSAIARMLMQLFKHWKISSKDQLELLGLSPSNRAALYRYRRGHPIAAGRDAIDRASHLLAIHKSLRLLFPRNRDLAYNWVTTRNRAFEGHTPVEVIREFGFAGLLMVRNYLDKALA